MSDKNISRFIYVMYFNVISNIILITNDSINEKMYK